MSRAQQTRSPQDFATCLHIFVHTLRPILDMLDSWLFEGTLEDPCNEFMITRFPVALLSFSLSYHFDIFLHCCAFRSPLPLLTWCLSVFFL